MSVPTRFSLYACYVATSTLIDQISSTQINPNTVIEKAGGDGSVSPAFACITGQDPRITLTTTAVKTLLDAIGFDGLAVAGGATFIGYLQAYAEGGGRATGSVHEKLTVSKGIIVPRRINVSHQGAATLDFEVVCLWDGTNDPIIFAGSQTLAGAPAVGEMYTLGPLSVNGSAITGCTELSIDFGIALDIAGSDGETWNSAVSIKSQEPRITVGGLDATQMRVLGLTGAAQGLTDSKVYLRARDKNGTLVANATTDHISFAIDDGIIHCEDLSGTHGEAYKNSIILEPTYDGAADILAIATGVAIT